MYYFILGITTWILSGLSLAVIIYILQDEIPVEGFDQDHFIVITFSGFFGWILVLKGAVKNEIIKRRFRK